MQALITGGTGFIGTALAQQLMGSGWTLVILTRQSLVDAPGIRYVAGFEELDSAEVFDAVINLAGASLAGRRWTANYKREIFSSRVDLTAELVEFMSKLNTVPKVLLCASAIGYYGHHGDECLLESSAVSPGFSQRLCQEWEAAARRAELLGTRVCLMRLGVVLDGGGGALQEMRRTFRFGVASWMGQGTQWLSWVHRSDVLRAIEALLVSKELEGAFNLTAPAPVTSRQFALALQQHHRTFFSAAAPAPVMRLVLGEMADELLLNGQRVLPQRLQDAGFSFQFPDIDAALAGIYKP